MTGLSNYRKNIRGDDSSAKRFARRTKCLFELSLTRVTLEYSRDTHIIIHKMGGHSYWYSVYIRCCTGQVSFLILIISPLWTERCSCSASEGFHLACEKSRINRFEFWLWDENYEKLFLLLTMACVRWMYLFQVQCINPFLYRTVQTVYFEVVLCVLCCICM